MSGEANSGYVGKFRFGWVSLGQATLNSG